MSKAKHRRVAHETPFCDNRRDFVAEGNLRIVHCGPGMPIVLLDDVLLSELVRFHFRPQETQTGYLLGRVQVLIVPVQE